MSSPDPLHDPENCHNCEEQVEQEFGPEFECQSCGVNTGEIGEYYMVHDFIWQEAGDLEGMLCIGCLENQIGRKLTPLDFPPLPVNIGPFFPRSELLNDRQGHPV